MQHLKIKATLPPPIGTIGRSFRVSYPRYGSGTVKLTPYGEYTLSTSGITEGAAKRMQEYKTAFNQVTMDMLHAYEAECRAYAGIHRKMVKVVSKEKFLKELEALSPQSYSRQIFNLPKPTKGEVEDGLREELKFINFSRSAEEKIDETTFIREHLNHIIETRGQAWQEAADLFSKIEDAKEVKENNRYMTEYRVLYQQKKDFIEGDDEVVKKGLEQLCLSVQVSYNIQLSFSYEKSTHLLSVEIVVIDGLSVPMSKATILSSGKISIKNKLVKEQIADRTNSAIGLIYFLSSHLYTVSPNIQWLQISLFEKDKQNPLLWVEFERNRFSKTRPLLVDVVSDILVYPHIMKLKTKVDSVELCPMEVTAFNKDVRSQKNNLHKDASTDNNGTLFELKV